MMNLCHCVFPSPLGKQRMAVCRKSGLFLLTVRSCQGEINEEKLPSPYSANQTSPHWQLYGMCRVGISNIYVYIKKWQPTPQIRHTMQCFCGLLRQGNHSGCKQGHSSETWMKWSTVSFTGQLFQKFAGFPLRVWELTISLHPEYPALFFSVGWDRRYQGELDSRHHQSGDA